MSAKLNVWFLAAEATPFVKVGGLGDVAGSLPPVLRTLRSHRQDYKGVDVRLVLPLHGAIRAQGLALDPVVSLEIGHSTGPQHAEVFQYEIQGLPVYFIAGDMIPETGPVYSGDPQIDGRKFIFFSLAALETARALGWPVDLVHANDWHTSPAVYWLGLNRNQDPFFSRAATLLCVHNLPYLGNGVSDMMGAFGLPPDPSGSLPDWARHLPLPLGLLMADHIMTVSPGYAKEMMTEEFGSGLHEFLRTREADISGVINGIPESEWDPSTDQEIEQRFSLRSLDNRETNKSGLQQELGLPVDPEKPLMAMVTRMFHQKGVDLALNALRMLDDVDWQLVLLGTGEPVLEEDARQLENHFPNRVRAILRYDPGLARRLYAGSDIMLIPSRYEPSGLTQMIAMRYGCVPVARATGGLRDTILDYHSSKNGTGFLFNESSPDALAMAVRRSLKVFEDKRRWRGIQRRGMQQDFSWKRSAKAYFDLYRRVVNQHRGY